MKSIWETENIKDYPTLNEDKKCNIVVIGGGLAGLLTAYLLSAKGEKVTLIEADKLFSGTTANTTAKISYAQGNIYHELSKKYGEEYAKKYFFSQKEAALDYAEIIKKENINCDLTPCKASIFSLENNKNIKLQGEFYDIVKEPYVFKDKLEEMEIKISAAIELEGSYHFNPLAFLNNLPKNFEIFEHTRVLDVDTATKTIYTEKYKVMAEKIIIATHFPIINTPGYYFLRMYQSISYTIAIDGEKLKNIYIDELEQGLSFRPYKGKTIIGGLDHRSGRNKSGNQYIELENFAKNIFGAKNIIANWCAEDCITFDGVPYAGHYSPSLQDVFVITGFNKWGMTNAMASAKVICDLICSNSNSYSDIFSPERKMMYKTLGSSLKNGLVNTKWLLMQPLHLPLKCEKSISKNNARLVFYHGKKRAIYKDYAGKLHILSSKCPHLGGELQWNNSAKSWDCPCHGSRFDVFGNILNEPTTKFLKSFTEASKK